MGRTPLWLLILLVGSLAMAAPAFADTATDIYQDFVSDGRIDGAYSDGALAAVADDASLFQYGDPSVTLGLRRAARLALEGGRDDSRAGSPPAHPAVPEPTKAVPEPTGDPPGEAAAGTPVPPGAARHRPAAGAEGGEGRSVTAPPGSGSSGDGGSPAAAPPPDPPAGVAGLQAGDPGPLIGTGTGILLAVGLVGATVGLGVATRRLRR